MIKLFNTVPHNFFTVLSSPNKEIYADCLFIIYNSIDNIEDSFQGSRDFIVSKLQDYFEDKKDAILEFEDLIDTKKIVSTPREKASAVLSTLKRTGWIGEEELGDYKTSINLYDYSIKIIETLKEISLNLQSEYTGDIFTVYSVLNDFQIEEGLDILEQAAKKTSEMIRRLSSLKANIHRYYYDITKNQSKDELAELLEKLLVDYKQNFFDSAYYNLKTKDSLPKYKRAIITSLSSIYENEEYMTQLTEKTMNQNKDIDYNEAYLIIEEKIRSIRDSFEGLDKLVEQIDRKNEQYINAAASKILYLTSSSDDVVGILNKFLQELTQTPNEDLNLAPFFNLTQARNLDEGSLFSPRRERVNAQVEEINVSEFSDELINEKLSRFTAPNVYSKENINNYVLEILGTDDSIEALEFPLNDELEFIKLILVFLYSKSVGVSYDIKLLDKKVDHNGVNFTNFIVFRKAN